MRRFGLIGYPLGHSFSKEYFMNKFSDEGIDAVYDNFQIESVDYLPGVIQKYPDLHGLNVTLPYKTSVIKYLDSVDSKALYAGAVNVISITVVNNQRKLKGYNTDIDGFTLSLQAVPGSIAGRALVLGTGGGSKAVQAGLNEIGIEYSLVSRDRSRGDMIYSDLTGDIMRTIGLVVNTTPLGMYPEIQNAPEIPYEYLDEHCILFDLVYNPEESLFLKKGREMGCRTKNGKEMLIIQAEKAWEIWNK